MASLFPGVELTSGQKVTAVVLHVDILSSCVHVSILPKLVAKKKSVSISAVTAALVFCCFIKLVSLEPPDITQKCTKMFGQSGTLSFLI